MLVSHFIFHQNPVFTRQKSITHPWLEKRLCIKQNDATQFIFQPHAKKISRHNLIRRFENLLASVKNTDFFVFERKGMLCFFFRMILRYFEDEIVVNGGKIVAKKKKYLIFSTGVETHRACLFTWEALMLTYSNYSSAVKTHLELFETRKDVDF